ncbi:MAG: hypothetical protein OIF47_06605 [Marinibacterium sp.]|nr:hypothetical protein [Marinibacterium sp.]
MSRGWHILRDGAVVTLARQMPARLEIEAQTDLPGGPVDPVKLAHQIRQDLWRALQRLRGYSPVVRIELFDDRIHVRAGGRALTPVPSDVALRIARVLDDPKNRARWMRFARRRQIRKEGQD